MGVVRDVFPGRYHLFFGSWTQDALQHPRTIGFANPAVLCYRNSALEVLLHLPVFVNMLKMHRVVCEVAGEDCLLCSMAEVSRLYWSSDLLTDEISQSVGKLWKLCMLNFWRPSLVDLKGHQDCAEFLMGFLTQVIKDWDEWAEENLIGETHPIADHVRHMFQSVIGYRDTCPDCNHTTIRPGEPQAALLATIPQNAQGELSIYDCLDSYMINKFSKPCDKCGKETMHLSREVIRDPSEVLVVQILRFNGDPKNVRRDTTPVSFPAELDLTRYLDSRIAGNKADDLKYTLIGVVRHDSASQDTKAGHYISYVKGPDATWCSINDDIVQEEQNDSGALRTIEIKGKDKDTISTPYILVYTRQPPSTRKDDATIAKEQTLPLQEIFSFLDFDVGRPDNEMDLPFSLHMGRYLDDFEESVQPSRNRWDAHAANIILQLKTDGIVMTGNLKGVVQKAKRKGPLIRKTNPPGIVRRH